MMQAGGSDITLVRNNLGGTRQGPGLAPTAVWGRGDEGGYDRNREECKRLEGTRLLVGREATGSRQDLTQSSREARAST